MINWPALQARTNTAALAVFGGLVRVNGVDMQGDFVEPGDVVYLDGVSAEATVPQVVIATDDVPANPDGKPVAVGLRNFKIVDVKPDGRGFSILLLEVVL